MTEVMQRGNFTSPLILMGCEHDLATTNYKSDTFLKSACSGSELGKIYIEVNLT
jgi:hypothetical protein